jgi:hypothetical protein
MRKQFVMLRTRRDAASFRLRTPLDRERDPLLAASSTAAYDIIISHWMYLAIRVGRKNKASRSANYRIMNDITGVLYRQ